MDNQNEEVNVFDGIVGLEHTKKKLGFYLNNYKNTNISPNLLLYSQKGGGKSTLSRRYASALTEKADPNKIKKYLEINSSTLQGVDSFFDNVVNPYLVDKDCTVFLDEAEAIPNELSLTLCTILNPNKENKNYFNYLGADYSFDFSRVSFILASTEIQKIHHALLDRLTIIDFDDYKVSDLAQIVKNNLIQFKITNELSEKVASVVRNNPRQAQKISNDIICYLKSNDKEIFEEQDWIDICNELNLRAYGLTDSEVRVLEILKENPQGSSLTKIASILGSTSENTRKFVELYPLKLGLMEVRPSIGRVLTVRGHELLNNL